MVGGYRGGSDSRGEVQGICEISMGGSKAFITQRCSNNHGRFLALAIYDSGGRRGFIAIPEGREG